MADQLITGTTLVESTSRSNGDVPVGGIIPWLKSMTGVYNITEGWVECNGQTLNDSLSSLNGQVIPDLNGDNRFLRGNSTSGGTGGAESASTSIPNHTHETPFATPSDPDDGIYVKRNATVLSSGTFDKISPTIAGNIGTTLSNPYVYQTGSAGAATVNTATVPPYYNVVWVMRVR